MVLRTLIVAVVALCAGLAFAAPAAVIEAPLGAPGASTRPWEPTYLGIASTTAVVLAAPAQVEPDGISNQPGPWCITHERYIANLKDQGMEPADGICLPVGPCDNAPDRDASIPTVDTPIKTFRLSIHVFCENNGNNCAATQADVDTAVARLNADYAPWHIQFIYETNFINSTAYRYLAIDTTEPSRMKSAHADSPVTKLNIYVVNTGGPPYSSWGTFPWDPDALGAQGGIVTDEFVFVATSPLPHILTHEVGHCLGLHHTHHGVDEVPQCGDCYEPAGRSAQEGDITGDRCSDTNPTPGTNRNCIDAPGTDPCSGNPWVATPYRNYMGYSTFCGGEFTPQQAGRMHCWTEERLSGWLQLPLPPAAPGTPTLTKLAGGVVRIAWTDNSNNEDGFRVQRERKQGGSWVQATIVADVGANTTTANDAPGAGTFRYRVQGYNAVGDSAWSAWKQINN